MRERYKYLCVRKTDNVIVEIMLNRKTNKYQFVSLTKGHICPCAFDTIEDAISDMEKEKSEGKLIDYFEIN